jgi:hypothetical protein
MRYSFANASAAELVELSEAGKVEVAGNLKIYRFDANDGPSLKIWRGRAKKPYAHYRFANEERREEYIRKQIANDAEKTELKLKHKAESKARKAETRKRFKVGTILHYSWGYGQTQCEYYEVIEVKGAYAIIREIAAKTVPGSEGFMCDKRVACPGVFIGPKMRKLIGEYGCRMASHSAAASPCDPLEENYCSWYH